MDIQEIWLPLPGFNDAYEISSLGRARRKGSGVRKLKRCKRGYLWLSVADGRGSARNISVARAVCEAFNGPPPSGFHVDHINRVRDDNRPLNLRWVTVSQNLVNRKHQLGAENHNARLTEDNVRHIRSLPFQRGQDSKIANSLGVSRETVRDARLGKLWRHI